MMKLALERHFETERENFNRSQRIKTLALFFIDDIQSFRGDENGQNAWLREMFNDLLKTKLEEGGVQYTVLIHIDNDDEDKEDDF